MKGKVIEIKNVGEFLVVKCVKGGYRMLNLQTSELSPWLFESVEEILTVLNVVGVREFKGEA